MIDDFLQMGVLSSIAIACGLLGPFLILKRMTMFANSLSHTILLGIGVAFFIAGGTSFTLLTLLIGALISSLMTALFTGLLVKFFRLQEDASIGLVFTTLFAIGITFVTLYMKNVHLGLESVMGNVDILSFSDLKLALSLCGINLAIVSIFFRQFQMMSFDSNLAKTMGMALTPFHFLLLFLTAATCIGAFRAVGVLIVLAFLVGPFLAARLFSNRLKTLLILTPCLGVFASVFGVLLSRLFFNVFGLGLSTGGIVATLIGLIYLFSKWIHSVRMGSVQRCKES